MLFIVISRLGDCKSAGLCNRLGRSLHIGCKKLEGPLQKAALVPIVKASEIENIPAAAEKRKVESRECCGIQDG